MTDTTSLWSTATVSRLGAQEELGQEPGKAAVGRLWWWAGQVPSIGVIGRDLNTEGDSGVGWELLSVW